MPPRETAPLGAPCWMELVSSDPEKSKDFYAELFGWTAQDGGKEYRHYVMFSSKGKAVAGMSRNQPGSTDPDGWSTYLATDDVQATAKAAVKQGGKVLMEPVEVGDQGTMVILCDAGGAVVGAFEAGKHTGFGVVGEAGAPVWHELSTRDYDETIKFYQDVFGWKTEVMSDSDDFRYTTLGSGNDALAGVYDAAAVLPQGAPASWQVYLGIDDVDAAVLKLQALGGTVQRAPWDSEHGRMAQVTDSTGAIFVLASV